MSKLRWGLILLFVSMLPWPALAGVPLDTVKAHANTVLDILRDPKLQGEAGKKIKEQRIEAAADDLFDFVELSKRTLGLNWNKLTLEQRKEFVQLFRAILSDAYVDKVASYTNEQVNFTKEVPLTETTVEVQSVVVSKSGQVLITYRVIKEEGGWKVYDVVIEGVSLVNNYRSQFSRIINQSSYADLVRRLKTKVSERQQTG